MYSFWTVHLMLAHTITPPDYILYTVCRTESLHLSLTSSDTIYHHMHLAILSDFACDQTNTTNSFAFSGTFSSFSSLKNHMTSCRYHF